MSSQRNRCTESEYMKASWEQMSRGEQWSCWIHWMSWDPIHFQARVCWICPRPLSSVACFGTQLHLRQRQTWATGLHIHLAKWGTPWGTFWTPTWKPVAWLFDTFGWVYPHDFLRSFRYLSSPFFPLGLFPILTSMEGIHSLDALVGDFLGRDGSVF